MSRKTNTKVVKMGIVRYLQLHPIDNEVLRNTLVDLYRTEIYTEDEWNKIIDNFNKSKITS